MSVVVADSASDVAQAPLLPVESPLFMIEFVPPSDVAPKGWNMPAKFL